MTTGRSSCNQGSIVLQHLTDTSEEIKHFVRHLQVLSKQRFVPCSVRQELSDRFNFISLIAVVAVPLLFGPLLCPLAHLVLSFCTCCCNKCLAANQRSSGNGSNSDNKPDTSVSTSTYRVTHQAVPQVELTSKQKLSFRIGSSH